MPTDLNTVKDHPAQILNDRDASLTTDDGRMPDDLEYAANVLRAYESNNNVTFAALDNDALAVLRDAYEGVVNQQGYISRERVSALLSAIDGLLGME